MRALIGGLVGAVASASVWLAAEHFQQTNYGWMVCLVGLVTGVCVHRFGTVGTGGGFARGAIAVLLTLAAIVGGRQVYAKIMQAGSPSSGVMTAQPVLKEEPSEEAEAGGEEAASAAPVLELSDEEAGLGRHGYSKSAMKKNLSEWDMIWMSLAALAAYISGKGGDPIATAVVAEEKRPEAPEEATEES